MWRVLCFTALAGLAAKYPPRRAALHYHQRHGASAAPGVRVPRTPAVTSRAITTTRTRYPARRTAPRVDALTDTSAASAGTARFKQRMQTPPDEDQRQRA